MNLYFLLKTIHIVALISFMAGILYLPRLFVYHSMQDKNSQSDQLLQTMEYKLIKYIINPAFIITFITGLGLSYYFLQSGIKGNIWIILKFILFLGLGFFHGKCVGYQKRFTKETNFLPTKFWRFFNEVPTIIMILMVILVIWKPF